MTEQQGEPAKFIVTQVGDNPPEVTHYDEPPKGWEEKFEKLWRELVGGFAPHPLPI